MPLRGVMPDDILAPWGLTGAIKYKLEQGWFGRRRLIVLVEEMREAYSQTGDLGVPKLVARERRWRPATSFMDLDTGLEF